jgi:hypothetical protein
MRIQITGVPAFKKAAKLISSLSPGGALSETQELLAKTLGYRDFHEFSQHASSDPAGPAASLKDIAGAIGRIADATGHSDSDIQFVVERSRLFSSAGAGLDTSLQLRATIWRARLFGAPGRNRPGTIVRVRSGGKPTRAILRFGGRPSGVIYDRGLGEVADFEVVTPRQPLADFVPSRLWLPYGFWGLSDGSKVVFSRDYYPLWRIVEDRTERLDPWLWVTGKVSEQWFSQASESGWYFGETRERALSFLDKHRVRGLPRLVEAMRDLMNPETYDMADAVSQVANRLGRGEVPSFARLNSQLFRS